MKSTIRSALLIVVGLVSIGLGIWCFKMDTGSHESNEYYGGDAYTGIQQASAQAANNIVDLANIAKNGFGSVLLVGGLCMIACSFSGDKEKPVVAQKRVEEVDELPDL